jgi:predicted nucleotidyltransferase
MKINKQQREMIDKIGEEHQLFLAILHGSAAKDQMRKDSDIDIGVLGKKVISFDELIELINEFTDVFRTNEVDVKSLHNTNPLFRYQVMRDGILLYGNQRDFNSFKAYAYRDYMDSQDLLKLKRTLIKKRLEDLSRI